jgi:hypothetical protein
MFVGISDSHQEDMSEHFLLVLEWIPGNYASKFLPMEVRSLLTMFYGNILTGKAKNIALYRTECVHFRT